MWKKLIILIMVLAMAEIALAFEIGINQTDGYTDLWNKQHNWRRETGGTNIINPPNNWSIMEYCFSATVLGNNYKNCFSDLGNMLERNETDNISYAWHYGRADKDYGIGKVYFAYNDSIYNYSELLKTEIGMRNAMTQDITDLNFSIRFINTSINGDVGSVYIKANISGVIQYANLSKDFWNVYIKNFSENWFEIYSTNTEGFIRFNWTENNAYVWLISNPIYNVTLVYWIQPAGSLLQGQEKRTEVYWVDRTLSTVTLTAPLEATTVNIGQKFQMGCSWTQSGTGPAETGRIHYLFNNTLAAAKNRYYELQNNGGGLTTNDTNPKSGTAPLINYSITVFANQSGEYWLNCTVYGTNLGANISSTLQKITVNAIPDYGVNLTIWGQLNGDKTVTYPTNSTVNGTCGADSGTCYLFGNITGNGMRELSVGTTAPFFVFNSSNLPAGAYNFKVNNTNNRSGVNYTLTIEKQELNLSIRVNNSVNGLKTPYPFDAEINITANATGKTTYIGVANITENGVVKYNLSLNISVIRSYNATGNFNISCVLDKHQNYTGVCRDSVWVNATSPPLSYCNNAFNDSDYNEINISSVVVCNRQDIKLGTNSNITIKSGGNLTLINETNLTFSMTADGKSYIKKNQTGALFIYNSTIKSDNSNFEYDFWAYGSGNNDNFTMQNSKITDAGYAGNPTLVSNGIQLFNISNTVIARNNISGGGQYGIYIQKSSTNNISDNTITSTNHGITSFISSSNSNIVSNNTIIGTTTGYGIDFTAGSFNIIQNNTINTSAVGSYGIYITSYNNATGNQIITGGTTGVGIYISGSNSTISGNNITTLSTGGGANGISIAASSYNNIVKNNTINITGGNSDGIYLLTSTNNNISSNNITTNGILGDGIFLDSNSNLNLMSSNTISTSGSFGYGIRIDSGLNSTIKNNIITITGSSGYGVAIASTSTNYTLISDNTITTGVSSSGVSIVSSESNNVSGNIISSSAYGIYLFTNANSNTLTSNTITTNRTNGYGIYLSSSSNSTLQSNTITTTGSSGVGVYLDPSSNSTITNNAITTTGSSAFGIRLTLGSNLNTLTSNAITTNGSSGYGIRFTSSLSNNITGNTITTNGGDGIGILFLGSSSNTLQSNTITTNGSTGVGIFLDTGSSNNNISLNNISSNKSYAINLASGTGNQLIENRVTSDLDYALAADDNLIKCDEERGVINITSAGAYSNTNISNCTTILVTKGNSFFNRIRVINNSYGFNITNIIKVNITNISVENSLYYDFIINKSEVTLLNSTFNNYLIEKGNLTVKWFLKFNITNSTGQIINNSNINISDNTTGVYETIFNGTVNETLPYWLEIYDYKDNGTFKWDYGLNITVNNSGYFDNSAVYDFSYSKVIGIVMQALGGGAVTFCNGAYTQGSGSWNITTLVICTLQNFIVNGRIIWDLNGNLVMNQSNITTNNLSINKAGKFLNMSIGSKLNVTG